MIYLLTYDISQTPLRNRIVEACLNRGLVRVQRSVFLGDLSPRQRDQLTEAIKEILNDNSDPSDSVLFMPACDRCFRECKTFGHLSNKPFISTERVQFL